MTESMQSFNCFVLSKISDVRGSSRCPANDQAFRVGDVREEADIRSTGDGAEADPSRPDVECHHVEDQQHAAVNCRVYGIFHICEFSMRAMTTYCSSQALR